MMQLEIEREALKREKDRASKERLERLEHDLANLRKQRNAVERHVDVQERVAVFERES